MSVEPWEERFWRKVAVTQCDDSCWRWLAGKDTEGYGSFWLEGGMRSSHRIAWFITYGGMPKNNLHVLHTCDNPGCCNPSHLFAGSHRENMRDMHGKNRHVNAQVFGEKHCRARLSEMQVIEIKRRLSSGESGSGIARAINMHRSTISDIKTGRNWRRVCV